MVRNPITAAQAKAFDLRDYRHLVCFLERHCTPDLYRAYKSRIVFNKRSIVFDGCFEFKFEVVDLLEDGRYTIWPMLDGSLVSDYLERGECRQHGQGQRPG